MHLLVELFSHKVDALRIGSFAEVKPSAAERLESEVSGHVARGCANYQTSAIKLRTFFLKSVTKHVSTQYHVELCVDRRTSSL